MRYSRFLALSTLAALVGLRLAGAHEGHEHMESATNSFAAGLLHPLTGLDHLLALVAVGLWSAQLGGKARWMLPTAFVGVMALGGLAGNVWGSALSLGGISEHVIAGSVLVLGVLLAVAAKLPVQASLPLLGMFALAHGWAHGSEAGTATSAAFVVYGLGFVLATAVLHLTGLSLGALCLENRRMILPRLAGGAIAACGTVLLLS